MTESSGEGGALIHNIHTLRGIACLLVVAHHALDLIARSGAATFYPNIGALGVDLFFVISGFVIVISTHRQMTPLDFSLRRIMRVVPLYWACTIAAFVLFCVVESYTYTENSASFNELVSSLFFIPYKEINGQMGPIIFVGWTLQYEMMFYAIFALSLFFRRLVLPGMVAAVLLCLAVAAGYMFEFAQLSIDFFTRPIILIFVGGLFLSYTWRVKDKYVDHLSAWHGILMIGVGVYLFAVSTSHNPFVAGVGATLIVGGALLFEAIGKSISNQISMFFGNISYSLYLIHSLAMYGLEGVLKRLGLLSHSVYLGLGLIGIIALSCFISWLSHKYIEVPLSKIGRQVQLSSKP